MTSYSSHIDDPHKVGAIIVAAGKSIRMMGRDKIFHSLLGKPAIVHTVTPFEKCIAVS